MILLTYALLSRPMSCQAGWVTQLWGPGLDLRESGREAKPSAMGGGDLPSRFFGGRTRGPPNPTAQAGAKEKKKTMKAGKCRSRSTRP